MYADKMTASMQKTIEATNYRREKQIKYNAENGIVPMPIVKASREIIGVESKRKSAEAKQKPKAYSGIEDIDVAADPVVGYMSREALEKAIVNTRKEMEKCAKELDFIQAAQYRDEMFKMKELLLKKYGVDDKK
jgi:excinuclease ABC subunit B